MATVPMNNNVLIEVVRDHEGVSRVIEDGSLQKGRLVDFAISVYHITASSGLELDSMWTDELGRSMQELIDKSAIVRWEQYAEGGQTFVDNGKTYALVPWWRLISFEVTGDEET